jgi:hypothetical protein
LWDLRDIPAAAEDRQLPAEAGQLLIGGIAITKSGKQTPTRLILETRKHQRQLLPTRPLPLRSRNPSF